MMLKWANMKKNQREVYLDNRDEQREIDQERAVVRAFELEAARKKVIAQVSIDGSLQVKSIDIEYTPLKRFGRKSQFFIPSKLLFYVEAFGTPLAFRVDLDFRYDIGSLTPKRRMLIRQTMPLAVELFLGVHLKYGCDLIYIAPADLNAWVDRAVALTRKPQMVA
jgi:hypothetical protein